MNDRDIVRLRVSLRAFNVMEGHNAARLAILSNSDILDFEIHSIDITYVKN